MSEFPKWYKGMKPSDRYKVKSRKDLEEIFTDQSYDHTEGYPVKRFGLFCTADFNYNMYKYCGEELNNICEAVMGSPWFCTSGKFSWILEWLDPVPDTIVEDINE